MQARCFAGRFLKFSSVFLFGFLILSPSLGRAAAIEYLYDTYFSANTVPPVGAAPWMSAIFKDTAGGVLLTISNLDLVGIEKVDLVDFNLNPNLNPASLTFSLQSSVGKFNLPTIGKGTNAFAGDGAGYYDIQLSFTTGGGTSKQFMNGESVSYLISGISGLTASDFSY